MFLIIVILFVIIFKYFFGKTVYANTENSNIRFSNAMNIDIEEIVKQVLAEMQGKPAETAAPAAAAPAAGGEIPKTAHVAVLTSLEHFDIKEYPMPEVGDDDILA